MSNRPEPLTSFRALILPGWKNSEADHWQSHWQRKFSLKRVEQENWSEPLLADWLVKLNEAICDSPEPLILIAHSLGCHLVAHWANAYPENTDRIKLAFLVTPPDFITSVAPPELAGFSPPALKSLPFASVLVGSENDPWSSLSAFEMLARAWGSEWINAGKKGHLGQESGVKEWEEGQDYLRQQLKRVRDRI